MDTKAITLAVEIIGSQAKVAAILEVSPGLVWQWVNGVLEIHPRHCLPLEQAVDKIKPGEVTRYDLLPKVFGEKPTAESKAA